MRLSCNQRKSAAASYLGTGAAFVAVAASGQPAFLGIGLGLLALGIAFLIQSRRERP